MPLTGRMVQPTTSIADLPAVRRLISTEMAEVDDYVRSSLRSDVVLIRQIAEYIIASGGKRLRPMLHILAARALGNTDERPLALAAIIEFIHTATLLHDDVVDDSDRRRGRETANAVWGNAASVLVGDFLYSRSFQLMVEVGSMKIMEILADATNTIAEGEVMQLLNLGDPDTSEQAYLDVVRCKTAKLFAAAGSMGAVVSNGGDELAVAMADFGTCLGMAFQLTDDALDYEGDAEALGKNVGDDLAEGKPTLPLIHILREGSKDERELIRNVLKTGGREHLQDVAEAIRNTDALGYVARRAVEYADAAEKALSPLPDSPYKDALLFLARFSCQRQA